MPLIADMKIATILAFAHSVWEWKSNAWMLLISGQLVDNDVEDEMNC